MLYHAKPCHATLYCVMICHAGPAEGSLADLLDLLLVGAAVNGPGGPLVVQPMGNLVKSLFQAVPIPRQASEHAIKMLASCLHLHLPIVQIAQTCPDMSPASLSFCMHVLHDNTGRQGLREPGIAPQWLTQYPSLLQPRCGQHV